MNEPLSFEDLRLCLEWQIELGIDEAISETPINRYDLAATATPIAKTTPPSKTTAARANAPQDPALDSKRLAAQAADLEELRTALAGFDGCELKKGARNLVFADGQPGARVMIIGEAPGREEDQRGLPFVGRAGQLLDRMLATIGLARNSPSLETAVYITNVLPWRPPQNRDPKPEEIAMLLPFLERHIQLATPELLIVMGNAAAQAVLGSRGITRLRGKWTQGFELPVLPMFHPAYLLRNPQAKREAWADLLALRAHLESRH